MSVQRISWAVACALMAGCTGTTATTAGSGFGLSSSASTGTSGGTVGSGTGASSAGSGTTGASGGSSSGASSSGTTTGPLPAYVDGGYVFCAIGGGDALVNWMCQAGTYFCGIPGACAQCRSDSDCVDQDLPTYDPLRPHCDLDSGVGGYWGFCQQCVRNADCAGQPGGNECDLYPRIDRARDRDPGLRDLRDGTTRLPQGRVARCRRVHAIDVSDRRRLRRSDRAGLPQLPGVSAGGRAVLRRGELFAVPVELSERLLSGLLLPSGLDLLRRLLSACNEDTDHCVAARARRRCSGPWPLCELFDAGMNYDAGELVGFCGCERDADCGDAGLRCLDQEPNDLLNIYGGKTCLFTCTDPRFPGCSIISPSTPVCDATSGLCIGCETDADCRKKATGPSLGTLCRSDGQCGCLTAKDCPALETCGGTGVDSVDNSALMVFLCHFVSPLACTPDTCGNDSACDVDSGICAVNASGTPACYSDFDCYTGDFCDPVGGCTGCANNSDCFRGGAAEQGYSRCSSNLCVAGCASDADCDGNPGRSHCLTQTGSCGCTGDADCAKSSSGHTCDTNPSDSSFGSCICTSSAECVSSTGGPGVCSLLAGGTASGCTTCASNSACPSDFLCAADGACTPRCDDGGAGCMAPLPALRLVQCLGRERHRHHPDAVWRRLVLRVLERRRLCSRRGLQSGRLQLDLHRQLAVSQRAGLWPRRHVPGQLRRWPVPRRSDLRWQVGQ